MSDSKSIMRQYMDAITRRDLDTIRELYHPQYSYTAGDGQRQEGAEAGIRVMETYTGAFPDLTFEVKGMHTVGDDLIVTEFVARGTHQGDLQGLAPTGRRVEIPICNFVEIRDGKIYAEREYFDGSHLLKQLGAGAAAHE